jgi:hypothetical protein
MITASSSNVNFPPGRYQLSTILWEKVTHWKREKGCNKGNSKKTYKRTNPSVKTIRDKVAHDLMILAELDDPHGLNEYFER